MSQEICQLHLGKFRKHGDSSRTLASSAKSDSIGGLQSTRPKITGALDTRPD